MIIERNIFDCYAYLDMKNKSELLEQIKTEVIALKQSPLYEYRVTNNYLPVIGEGSLDSKILFIGEAPGRKEAECGRPFCGAAGRILNEALLKAGLKREEVYITNIVKDRPPENRDPSAEEIALYAPFLDRQIEIIKPLIVATLGRISTSYIMNRYGLTSALGTITKLHGQVFEGISPNGQTFKFIPMFHPAATIYNKTSRADFFTDMVNLRRLCE